VCGKHPSFGMKRQPTPIGARSGAGTPNIQRVSRHGERARPKAGLSVCTSCLKAGKGDQGRPGAPVPTADLTSEQAAPVRCWR